MAKTHPTKHQPQRVSTYLPAMLYQQVKRDADTKGQTLSLWLMRAATAKLAQDANAPGQR